MITPAPNIAAVRGFNRFYTRQIGVLRKGYLDSPFSLERSARALRDRPWRQRLTASDIARALDLDAGYLSRLLRNFEKRGLIERKASAEDARQSHLALTARGRRAFAPLEKRSQQQAGDMLGKLKSARAGATGRGDEFDQVAARRRNAAPGIEPILRAPKPGDFGWIVTRHAQLYAQEYGWTDPFEGLCAQIVADFVNKFDAKKERAWIAEFERRECRLDHAGEGFGRRRPHPPAAGRPEGARARARRQADRRMHQIRPRRRLQEDHAMDAPHPHAARHI